MTDIHWDSLDAQAEYSPDLISVQQATLVRGKTPIHVSGELHAHQTSHHHNAFDDDSASTRRWMCRMNRSPIC